MRSKCKVHKLHHWGTTFKTCELGFSRRLSQSGFVAVSSCDVFRVLINSLRCRVILDWLRLLRAQQSRDRIWPYGIYPYFVDMWNGHFITAGLVNHFNTVCFARLNTVILLFVYVTKRISFRLRLTPYCPRKRTHCKWPRHFTLYNVSWYA